MGGSIEECPSPVPGPDGNVTVQFLIRSLAPPNPEAGIQSFTFRTATCEGGGTSSGGWPLMLMGAACHPSGNGFDVTVSSLSLVAGVDYLSLATRTGGTEFPCGQDSANPAHWHCRVSNPVPTDLQFCYLRASGSPACATFDRGSLIAALPTRCGGSELNDRWSISVGCENTTSDDNLIVNVGILGGRNPYDIKAGYRSTTWYGTPNPGMPNFFQITIPRSFITQDLLFTASFPGEDQLDHTENLTSITPETCKPEEGTGTGIGGLCADIPSASGWQNPANQYDVNNDGCVTPMDVLLGDQLPKQRILASLRYPARVQQVPLLLM